MSEKLYIKDIKENKADPRRKRRQGFIKQLADSIKSEGLLQPLIVNQDKTLVDGHYRLLALKKLGVEWLCWDKEKRIATMPRDKDFDADVDSMAVNTLRDPQTPLEKAYFIDKMINAKILKNITATSPLNTKSFLHHMSNVKQHGYENKYPEWEEETFRILNAANVGGIDGALNLLDMLDWNTVLQDSVDDGEITLSYGQELSRVKDKKVQKKLLKAIKQEDVKHGELRKWVNVIKDSPETEKLFNGLVEKKADKNERESALKIVEKSLEKKHVPSEEEMTEIVNFVHDSKDTVNEWTDVRVEQAVEAMTEGKRIEEVDIVSDADQRILKKYKSIVENMYHFNADHIRHFHSSKARNEAVNYLWTVENFVRKTLRDLNEINVMDADYVQVKEEEE